MTFTRALKDLPVIGKDQKRREVLFLSELLSYVRLIGWLASSKLVACFFHFRGNFHTGLKF